MIENAIEAVVDSLDIDFSDLFTAEFTSPAEGIEAIEALGDEFRDSIYEIDEVRDSLRYLTPENTTLTREEVLAYDRELFELRQEANQVMRDLAEEYREIVHSTDVDDLEDALEDFENEARERLEGRMEAIDSRVAEIKMDIYMSGGQRI